MNSDEATGLPRRREKRDVHFSMRLTLAERAALGALAELSGCDMTEVLSFLVREAAKKNNVWKENDA